MDEPQEALAPVQDSAPQVEVTPPTLNPAAEQQKRGVVYKVQFMTSGNALKENAREFKGITDYEYYLQRGTYCYTTGSFATAQEAVKHQKAVRERGFKDAFVVAFLDGERISLQKAKELLEQ